MPMSEIEPMYRSDEGDAVLYLADCAEAMQTLPPDTVDAVITDP
jgi:hypothetical protein